jgi:hypothetical protein
MTFSLPCCPPNRIEEAFQLLEAEIETFGRPSLEAFARNYLEYIRTTYMSGSYGPDGAYEWNFYNRMEEGFLTNKMAEGANNRLAIQVRIPHPGIYQFGKVLAKEMEHTRGKCEQFEAGNLQRIQGTRAKTTERTRLKLKIMLE